MITVMENWANLIRFGQNQNLVSPKTFDLLRLCETKIDSEYNIMLTESKVGLGIEINPHIKFANIGTLLEEKFP